MFLTGYQDLEAQYKGLMDNGITFAKRFNLTPGVALSPLLRSHNLLQILSGLKKRSNATKRKTSQSDGASCLCDGAER